MQAHKIKKLENEERVKALNPVETLKRMGIKEGIKYCDMGAGSGLFAIPAAEIYGAEVSAVDVAENMLAHLEKLKVDKSLVSFHVIKGQGTVYPLDDNAFDLVSVITVMHEIPELDSFISELSRITKTGGTLCVIEFIKKEMPMGPPMAHRISADFVREHVSKESFVEDDYFELSQTFYGIVFKKV